MQDETDESRRVSKIPKQLRDNSNSQEYELYGTINVKETNIYDAVKAAAAVQYSATGLEEK